MKKLSLILALALSLASSAFAGQPQRIDSNKLKKSNEFNVVRECPKYEIKDNDTLYYEGKPNGDDLNGLMLCGNKIKGYDKAKQRQEKRDKEYQEKHAKK